jgi:predicted NBD/HSP70 family sugar kinase
MSGADGRPLRQQVFERVRAAGAIARIDLAKALGVSPASVTTISAELIEAGLVREVDFPKRDADAGRGRPPVALGVNPGARHIAGLKLSDHAHSAVIMDFAGNVTGRATLARDRLNLDAEAVAAEAGMVLDAALEDAGLGRGGLAAVGAGLPGLVQHETGQVLWSPIISERNVAFGPILSQRLGIDTRVDNDSNLLTLAELWFGMGRSLPGFVMVTIERGVGMGLVVDNQLWRGGNGFGMEFGHIKVQLDGALCRCGQRGCLEAYVADYALVREASTALDWEQRSRAGNITLIEGLYAAAQEGDEAARTIFQRAGRYLAAGLANIANLLDPPLIILSGERMRYDHIYAEAAKSEMRNMTLLSGRTPPQVVVHAWSAHDWARGAGAIALQAATDAALGLTS